MTYTFFSMILVVAFLFMGVQVRGGNTDVLGKGIKEQIKPEHKMDYCREISIPIFMFAVLEVVDILLQTVWDIGAWSLVVFGTGMVLCFLWIYIIHSRYKR